jgi:radical SAM protein with 4Fe4S-binding SPASM domain
MLTERDITINMIMTNGRLITPEILDGLEKLGQSPKFQVSFDGVGHHDSMRGVKGAEEAALSAIRLLVSRNYAVTSSMCIDRESAGSIRETINLLADIGIDSVSVTTPQKFGAWEKVGDDRALSFEESMEIFLEYIPRFFEDGMPVFVSLGGAFSCNKSGTMYSIPYLRKFDTDEKLQKHLICTSARYNVYISAECRLMPCLGYSTTEYADEFPDILEIPLKEALSRSKAHDIMMCRMREYFARNEKCRTCEKRLKCAGGCRVNAMIGGKDNLSIDEEACRFHLGGYEERITETANNAIKRARLAGNTFGIIPRAIPGEG